MSLTRLLQLASPALPIGGYSYSTGLESGIESGRVRGEAEALDWIRDAMTLSMASFDAPLMLAALRLLRAGEGEGEGEGDGPRLTALRELDALAIAARETAEFRLESTQMGFSLGQWQAAVLPGGGATDRARQRIRERLAPRSLPVAWAFACAGLGLGEREAALGLLWSFAENQVMVLMKALPMGQMAAQRVLAELGPRVEAAADAALALGQDDWSSAAPALSIASMRHETQYSRLFRS